MSHSKVVVVTGVSSGIGRAAALSLAVELVNGGSGAQFGSAAAAAAHVAEQMDYLVTRCTFVRPCAAFSVVSRCDRCMLWPAVRKLPERARSIQGACRPRVCSLLWAPNSCDACSAPFTQPPYGRQPEHRGHRAQVAGGAGGGEAGGQRGQRDASGGGGLRADAAGRCGGQQGAP